MTGCSIFRNIINMCKTFFDFDCLTSKKKLTEENESLLLRSSEIELGHKTCLERSFFYICCCLAKWSSR